VDIGLRLAGVEAMDLQSEPVERQGSWLSRSATLAEHGPIPRESDFLQTQQVELDAMTAPVFIDFFEHRLAEQDVWKTVPEHDIPERHARWMIGQRLVEAVVRNSRVGL
jgi:hypothetical protein